MTAVPQYVEGHNLLLGKSVLITAAAGAGIGFATAKRAVEEGARAVIISDIHAARLERAVESLIGLNRDIKIEGYICDVTSEKSVQALVQTAESNMSGVDI